MARTRDNWGESRIRIADVRKPSHQNHKNLNCFLDSTLYLNKLLKSRENKLHCFVSLRHLYKIPAILEGIFLKEIAILPILSILARSSPLQGIRNDSVTRSSGADPGFF